MYHVMSSFIGALNLVGYWAVDHIFLIQKKWLYLVEIDIVIRNKLRTTPQKVNFYIEMWKNHE